MICRRTIRSLFSQHRWVPHPLTFASAILIVASFPPWNLWPLIWVALIPWFWVLKRSKNLTDATIQGFWLGYSVAFGAFYWVAYVLKEFGNLPWPLSFVGLLGFCLFGQPQYLFFAPLFKLFETPTRLGTVALGLALCFAGIDWILPKIFMDTLGHALFQAKHLRQIADLGGIWCLTSLVVLANYTLWQVVEKIKKSKPQLQSQLRFPFGFAFRLPFQLRIPRALFALLTFTLSLSLAAWTYGYLRYHQVQKILTQTQTGFHASAIQANIGDFDKLAAENGARGAAHQIVETFIQMTETARNQNPSPQLVIWPETSYPSTFGTPHTQEEKRLEERIRTYVQQTQLPLLFGGYDHKEGKDYNSLFLLPPSGEVKTYHKNILLLFGEYIPGAETFPLIKDTFPQVGNFGRGTGPEVIEVPLSPTTPISPLKSVRVGPIICYEVLFPQFVIEAARKGSQVILNITNDSWFGNWGEPQLHLALSTFRSIESRLPMIRTTNTGISALILPDGEITQTTPLNSPQIMTAFVPLSEPIPTLMKAWGDWFGAAALGIGMILLGLVFRRAI